MGDVKSWDIIPYFVVLGGLYLRPAPDARPSLSKGYEYILQVRRRESAAMSGENKSPGEAYAMLAWVTNVDIVLQ